MLGRGRWLSHLQSMMSELLVVVYYGLSSTLISPKVQLRP